MDKLKILLVVICAAIVINLGGTAIRKTFMDNGNIIAEKTNESIQVEYDLASK